MDFKALFVPPGGGFTKTLRVMKLSAIILLAASLHLSAAGIAQKVTLSEKNAPLEKVFAEIKRQTGYAFFFDQAWMARAKAITVDMRDEPIADALDECFKDQPLTYAIVGQTVVVRLKEAPIGDAGNVDTARHPYGKIAVHGRVTDSLGNPLSGASVQVERTNKVTTSDENGEFTLGQVDPGAFLIVSFVGYGTQNLPIAGNPEIRIRLSIANKEMAQVIVGYNSGYQKISPERATGSFAFVDSNLFNERVGPDVLSRLEGNVPDLLFNKNTTGAINGGIDISIRGINTLFANAQPLIVVDNFAYDGDINNINPNDVESITILKDAAAASIWGVRSGNGVIVITTKKGKRNGKMFTQVNANITVSSKPDLFYSPNFLDANDYIDVEEKLFPLGVYNSALSKPYNFVTPVVEILAQERAGNISVADGTGQIDALRKLDVRNDLSKYFYQRSVAQQYAANFRGGGANNDYFLSFGYDKNLANQDGNTNNRITVNSLNNFYPTKRLQFSFGLNYVQNYAKTNSISGTAGNIYPYGQLADARGNPLAVSVYGNLMPAYTDSLTRLGYLNWQYKPLAELGLADNENKEIDARINLGIKYNFINDLTVELRYQYERASTVNSQYNSDSTFSTRNLINLFTQDNSGTFTYPIPIGGISNLTNTYLTSQQIRGQLNYQHHWSGEHELIALAGVEIRGAVDENNSSVSYGYDKSIGYTVPNIDYADNFKILPTGSTRIPNGSGFGKTTNNFISYFSNAAYTYLGKYVFSLSGRIDHSNLFGVSTNQKAVPLYSAGISWNLSKEGFYHIRWLPFLKPRLTYGYTANINTSATAITTIKQSSYPNDLDGLNYSSISNPGNPELRWEKNRMINAGIDYAIKDNIVSGSLEFYFKKGIDLFGKSPLPTSTGLNTFFGNSANTSGHGYDIQINSTNINRRNFRWTTNFSLSHIHDIVTKYDVQASVSNYFNSGAGNFGTITPIVGAQLFGVYSYKWAGLSHDTGDPQGFIGGKPSTDYRTIINTATFDSLQFSGTGRPTFYGFLRNTFSYRRLSLSFNIMYKLNYYFRRQSTASAANIAAGLGQGLSNDYIKRWQKPGDELTTNVPSFEYPPYTNGRGTFYEFSSVLVEKGDHIRLEDIKLNYDISKSQWRIIPFSPLSVYVYVNNVGILWRANKDHLDPDQVNAYAFPTPRTFAFGITANF